MKARNHNLFSVTAKFDIDRLCDKVKNARVRNGDEDAGHLSEDHLSKFFSPTKLGVIEYPATVVDEHGRVILWYLPDIVTPFRVVSALLGHPFIQF